MRTVAEINEKITNRTVQVCTIEELKSKVKKQGIKKTYQEIDVVCTGTFEPMESSGAIINLGHTDPPIKIRQCWLDGVPTYAGFGAVDLCLGATVPSEYGSNKELGENLPSNLPERGGAHVIEDLIAGKAVPIKAVGQVTDCYPRASFESTITIDSINQFYLYNPRNLYQNFIVGVNGGDRTLYTYLGPLLPRLGNAVYSSVGALSPLLNDPDLEVIGIGTKIFLGGAQGYIAWEGTQHFPRQKRLENRTPIGPASTVALVGDAKKMNHQWVKGCYFKNYGSSLMLGVGIPIPLLSEKIVANCAVDDRDIVAPVMDFSIPRRVRPSFGLASYAHLKSGKIKIEGQVVRVASVASLYLSRQVAQILKQKILDAEFTLTEAVASLPCDRTFIAQDGAI
ncbi:homocysteine biosynthesis protein [Cyanobacterium stanieri LEGE 03274]|uniref:Homocysteine biosynthesis protein n=1 Tax=Cyanobacterium stanieri LEGE 03274 TaxID=1828756 RepID=A0ABR9V7E1_9CHRO|nr:homocysteine biosynthesis protein [Cyanobacterium stanieri]MBE9223813.1 homocysteine biosynthesis protein [Cyanobacterium stanieri LEGE 03274]